MIQKIRENIHNMSDEEVLHLALFVVDCNNFMMEQEFKGDACISAGELMKRAHALYDMLSEDIPNGSEKEE